MNPLLQGYPLGPSQPFRCLRLKKTHQEHRQNAGTVRLVTALTGKEPVHITEVWHNGSNDKNYCTKRMHNRLTGLDISQKLFIKIGIKFGRSKTFTLAKMEMQ